GGAPTDPPALLAMMAWARRENQRTLGGATPDVTPQATPLALDTVSEPLALTAAAPAADAATLTPHGSASVANNVFTLTTASNQAGTAMSTGRIDVRQNFTIAFDVNLGTNDAGADGAAIVFHNDPRGANAIGAPGSGLAVGGIQNGLAIEFDTYNSSA